MKFTIYVLSDKVKDFKDALAPGRLDGATAYKEIGVDGVDFEAKAYMQRDHQTEPGWYDVISGYCTIKPPPVNISNSLIVVVKTASGRFCAVAFGHGHHALNRTQVVEEYGREVAERLLDPAKIKAVDSKGIGRGALQKHNVSPTSSDLAEFPLNPNRDRIRRVTGESPDKSLGKRVTGATPLVVDGNVGFADLGLICETVLKHHKKTRNRRFAAYDPFIEVKDNKLIQQLNKTLDSAVLKQSASIGLLTERIEDWDRIDKVQVSKTSGNWLPCADFDMPSIAKALTHGGVKPPFADDVTVQALDAAGNELFSRSLRKLAVFETSHAGKPYALSDGTWFELHQEFRKRIEQQLRELEVKRDPLFLLPWDLKKHRTELKYNQSVAKAKGSSFLCLDQNEVVTKSSGSIEACDLLTIGGMFIHVKRWDGSQKMSAHSKQASNAGQVMRNNQEFRDALLKKLPGGWLKKRPWKDFSAGFSARNHKVVIAIADAPHRTIPDDLPIFSKITLMDEYLALRAENYDVAVYHIPLSNKGAGGAKKKRAKARRKSKASKAR